MNFCFEFFQELSIDWEAISNTRKSVSSYFQAPRSWLKKARLRIVFPTYFSVFRNRRKHSSSCLIYYLKLVIKRWGIIQLLYTKGCLHYTVFMTSLNKSFYGSINFVRRVEFVGLSIGRSLVQGWVGLFLCWFLRQETLLHSVSPHPGV